jgi:2-polyprenyl-3-methyl-5-hydroxy-6-metoxy-1,4-benzoquinol methylase
MQYSDNQLRTILQETIINDYRKNPIILLSLWNAKGEQAYIDFLQSQYEKILLDFNKIFTDNGIPKRVLEISSFLGVIDITLAKIGFEVHTYDIPEFQQNGNLNKLYSKYNVHPSSGYLKDVGKTGLPYPENHFDAVILSEVLEHLSFNPLPVLQEINRTLKKGGILYITTPNQVRKANRINMLFGHSIRNDISDSVIQLDGEKKTICGIHWREYTLLELMQLLEITGFTISTHYFFPMTKTNYSFIKKILMRMMSVFFPSLENSITIIAHKIEYKPMKFWFYNEYIKYYKNL